MIVASKLEGQFAISTTGGRRPISVRTLAAWAHDLVGNDIAGFRLKRIRSGIETLLAAAGVPAMCAVISSRTG
ncbi:MAG TPA: hypothetical protein VH041_14985 [Caldimonas sp.]|nr:hypothetical protein [Caldimonas sp.]HEX4235596.1 hypothetical protein [Caldimonas sp.]